MSEARMIDAEGYIIDVVVVPDGTPNTADTITTRPPDGLFAARWTGTEWVEAAVIYFEYVTADAVEKDDGTVLTTGEIVWAYCGRDKEFTPDEGCSIVGPYPRISASAIILDAGVNENLYWFVEGELQRKPEPVPEPTDEEKIAALQDKLEYYGKTIYSLRKQISTLQESSTTTP